MLVVGLTGSMGCGKSTVAAMLGALGAGVADADQLAREAVAPGSDGWAAVVARFGVEVLTPEGALDRGRMAERVFASTEERRALEAIIHPRVRRGLKSLLTEWAKAGKAVVILEVPLLFETGLDRLCDLRLVVVCGASQEERLTRRGGMSAAARQGVLACQTPEREKQQRADGVIDNRGGMDATRRQVEDLWAQWMAMPPTEGAWPTLWRDA